MALKFSPNLNTMFTETPLINRFEVAAANGFKIFELQNPYELTPEAIREKLSSLDIKCDLINIYSQPSIYGCAAIPVHEDEFLQATQKVMNYYYAMGFKKLHILSGVKDSRFTEEDHTTTLIRSLKSLVEGDYLENINVTALIEPISDEVISSYFLNNFDLAVEIIKEINSSQVKLLLDIYHLHKITGDVKQNLEKYYNYAGHIQISQDPGRREPFFPEGKIDYRFVLDFLRQRSHSDYIGLEYFPSESTVQSLSWMQDYI